MKHIYSISLALLLISCQNARQGSEFLPSVPDQAEALSLLGEPLYSSEPSAELLARYKVARAANLREADNLIWFGRFTAYTGNYRDAILIFSQGVGKFPKDPRFLRHRGHRYITVREFDRAISDLEKAAVMTEGQPDEAEPDGMPNPLNIPVSTLKSNIFYHLGLAWYLKGDHRNSEIAFRKCIGLNTNDDNLVSATHWLYMSLIKTGRFEKALEALEEIQPEMNVIENMAYHRLCLMYKGEIPAENLEISIFDSSLNEAMAYGVGNWYLDHGHVEKAEEIFNNILRSGKWPAFGYIAAEAAMANWEKSKEHAKITPKNTPSLMLQN